MEKGVIYIATGEKYLNEAFISVKSLKRHNPGLSVSIFTDCIAEIKDQMLFDRVITVSNASHTFYDKTKYLIHSPYYYTLFLDTDTYVLGNLDGIFKLLHRFDIVVAHAPIRTVCEIPSVPSSFVEFNTGVIGFRKTDKVFSFLREVYEAHLEFSTRNDINWKIEGLFRKGYAVPDQPVFREILFKRSDINFYVLPPEYNYRFVFPGTVYDEVRILHGHFSYKNMESLGKKINAQINTFRTFMPFLNTVVRIPNLYRLSNFIKKILQVFK